MKKRFLLGVLMVWMLVTTSSAQTNMNSPYSQYGIGMLQDQSTGFSRGMNGAAIGMREGNLVNTLNPASYAAVDSLTMIFDMGLSGQYVHFKEGGHRLNAKSAGFDYIVTSFRLLPKVGMSLGIIPYSNVGYKYTAARYLNSVDGTLTETHEGKGGLNQAYLGVGWQVTQPLSVGVNVSYFWGSIDRSITSSSTTYIQSLSRVYSASVSSYKLDFGVQWQQRLNKRESLTLGATVGLGHKLGADPTCMIINVSNTDTTSYSVTNGLSIPMSYGLGASWKRNNNLMVNADVTLETWGSLDFPSIGSDGKYAAQSDFLKNRYQMRAGTDYVPDPMGRKLYKRIHYRLGAGYATPYYNINGNSGPKELSLSAGFGIPLQNSYNNRSLLNISAQWIRRSASGLITEDMFRINVGLTFNERWFAKWKVN